MNNQRRKEIAAAISNLEAIQALVEEVTGELENIRDEEQEYFDNMPESLQSGDRGMAAEQAVGYLEEAISQLGDVDYGELISSVEAAAA